MPAISREHYLATGLVPVAVHTLTDNEQECLICRESFRNTSNSDGGKPEAPVRIRPCGHVFGEHCIRHWLATQRTCPTCREELFFVIPDEMRNVLTAADITWLQATPLNMSHEIALELTDWYHRYYFDAPLLQGNPPVRYRINANRLITWPRLSPALDDIEYDINYVVERGAHCGLEFALAELDGKELTPGECFVFLRSAALAKMGEHIDERGAVRRHDYAARREEAVLLYTPIVEVMCFGVVRLLEEE